MSKVSAATKEKTKGKWTRTEFSDGNVQWYEPDKIENGSQVHIEKVIGRHSQRKNWVIIDREPLPEDDESLYPPILSGPYPTLAAAKAAYRVITS